MTNVKKTRIYRTAVLSTVTIRGVTMVSINVATDEDAPAQIDNKGDRVTIG